MPKSPATPAPAPAKPRRQRKPKNVFALPVRAKDAPPIPAFTPVPRERYRHDGWTPERQRAFIGALADTGCVSRAARMVNMAQVNCYTLRRAPGAGEFRAAWDAALDCGLAQMKDIAFERAIEGELIPVFANGKHMGFRRKRNDALLMFCLRHYGKDAAGKRTTINYFSSRASAGAAVTHGPSEAKLSRSDTGSGRADVVAGAEASATTVTTVITGNASGEDLAQRQDKAAASIEQFAGVTLDDEAKAEIMAALEACAAREQALEAAYKQHPNAGFEMAADEDLSESFLPLPQGAREWQGTYEPPVQVEEVELADGEAHWSQIGLEKPDWVVEFEKAAAEKAAEDERPDGLEGDPGLPHARWKSPRARASGLRRPFTGPQSADRNRSYPEVIEERSVRSGVVRP